MNTPKSLLLLATCLGLSALAEESVSQFKPLKVKASRMPADPSKTGASLTVLDAGDLEPHGALSLSTFLKTVPGIHFAQSGPRGSVNSLLLRGATQKYTVVRIDGVNISDPSAGQIAPQIEHILVGNIEKIEILRGSQSSLYGGQAVAGVIEITTKTSEPGTYTTLQIEGGSFDTYSGQAGVRMASEKGFLNVMTQYYTSDGFSSADEKNGNTEKDGYENLSLNLNGNFQLTEDLLLKGSARYSDHEIEFDAFEFGAGPVDDDGTNVTKGDQTHVSAGADYSTMDGRQDHQILFSFFETNRDTEGEFPATFKGERLEADYLLGQEVSSALGMLVGLTAIEESADTSSNLDNSNQIYGAFLQLDSQPVENMYFTASVRADDHSEFGNHTTWKLTGAHTPLETVTFRGSVGTGFRAPSLFELFDSQFGNSELDPETSMSWDFGVDQSFWNERAEISVTYFSLEIADQIDFAFPDGYVQVPGESIREGIEMSFGGHLTENLLLVASYTYMIKAETDDGSTLLRVPEHDVSVTSIYTHSQWTLSGILSFIAGVDDLNYNLGGAPTAELDAYWVLGGRIGYEFEPGKVVFIRLENIFDEDYQQTRGYGTAGLSAYAGLSLDL